MADSTKETISLLNLAVRVDNLEQRLVESYYVVAAMVELMDGDEREEVLGRAREIAGVDGDFHGSQEG